MNNKLLQNNGFSLVEMLLTIMLIGGLGLVSAKILEMIQDNSKLSEKKEVQLSYFVRGVEVIKSNLGGLKKNQFDGELFYKIASQTGILSRNSTTLQGSNLYDREPTPPDQLTSFVFKKKVGKKYLSYLTACLPVATALDTTGLTYALLSKNAYWPFVRKENGSFAAYCCKRDDPMCTDKPIFKKDSHYTVQIFRYDPDQNNIVPILKRGEVPAISGLGYFLFSHDTNENILYSRFFAFYNECVSQSILLGASKPNCKDHVWFKVTEVLQNFSVVSESANDLGGDLGL